MLVIFLNNKLISADTIAPLVHEFSRRYPEVPIEVTCYDRRTLDVILTNPVVYDVFRRSGRFYALSGSSSVRLRRIVVSAVRVMRLAWFGVTGRATFVHFRALNHLPLKVLYYLNPSRTFFCQSANAGLSDAHTKALRVLEPRDMSNPMPSGRLLIAFDSHWWGLHDQRLAAVKKCLVSPPYRRPMWHEHIREILPLWLQRVGVSPSGQFFVFMLSPMDRAELLYDPDGYPELFLETLEILADVAPEIPVLIKRHPATLPDFIHVQDDLVKRSRHRLAKIVDVHPMVLAIGARAFIANSFTSTFEIARYMGVTTVEYTRYSSKALAATGGGSINPTAVTEFVNDAPDRMRRLIASLAVGTVERIEPEVDTESNFEDLLSRLAGSACAPAGA